MSILQAFILGTLQGLTEFLPVSSSGHLVLGQALLDVKNSQMLSFDVYVHFGTLISVCVAFRVEITKIVASVWRAVRNATLWSSCKSDEYVGLGAAIVVASIPAAIVGLAFHSQIAEAFRDPKLVEVDMIVTGLLLYLTRFSRPLEGRRVGLLTGFLIGLVQAFSVLPGISRAGTTMSSAMYLRVPPALAARFSFLLSIPVIAGAALLESKGMIVQGMETGFEPFIVGTIAAATTGYIAIKLLLRVIERGRFSWFAFYCFAVGIAALLFI